MSAGMQIKTLGKSGIRVSEFCFGVLPLGPLQANLPLEESLALIQMAQEKGVTFFDTAALYGTEALLGDALKGNAKAW